MNDSPKVQLKNTPTGLEDWLFFIGIAFAALGVLGSFLTWPDYITGTTSYALPLITLISGIIWCATFLSIAKVLQYLRKILWVLSDDSDRRTVFDVAVQNNATPKKTFEGGYGENFPQH